MNRTLLEWAGIALAIVGGAASVYTTLDQRVDDLQTTNAVLQQQIRTLEGSQRELQRRVFVLERGK